MDYTFKGTEGKWSWDGNVWDYDKDNEAPWLLSDKTQVLSGQMICNNEHDAHLIAASPDLLEACIKIESLLSKHCDMKYAEVYSDIRDAIHKALNIK